MFRKTLGLTFGLALLTAVAGAADTYTFGGRAAANSEIGFNIKHWVINMVHGTFDKFDGTLKYDEKNIEKSKVEVTIDAASINTRNEMRDRHLRSADFFDVEKNPTLTFKSTKVTKASEGSSLAVTGDLSIRGVTKSVVLDVTINGKSEDQKGNVLFGFKATTKINRMDFGVAWNMKNKTGAAKLADEVEIVIMGEAELKK